MSAFIGSGIVSIAPWDDEGTFDERTFRDVGNVSALTIAVEEDRRELRNFRNAAGGVYASVARVSNATINMDFRDFTPENFAEALWGASETVAGQTTVEALIRSAPLIAVKFDGINAVDGEPVVGKFYKVRLGAPQNVELIGEDFGTLSVSGTLEADTEIDTVGESQYFALVFGEEEVTPP